MLDFSRAIALSTKSQQRYRVLRTLLFVGFFLSILAFGIEILLPHLSFRYNAAIHSLANTVTPPTQRGQKTHFSVVASESIDKVRVSITLRHPLEQAPILSLQKSYGAFLYPLTISPQTDEACIINATPYHQQRLLASREGVFVTSYKNIHPFDTIETFLASGYDFATITKDPTINRAQYHQAKIFTLSSYHPPQTIFQTRNNYYCVRQDQTLEQIAPPSTTTLIAVDARSRKATRTCTLQRGLLRKNTYHCTLTLEELRDFPGKRYAFTLSEIPPENIAKIHVILSTQKTYANVRTRLQLLHTLLINRYTH